MKPVSYLGVTLLALFLALVMKTTICAKDVYKYQDKDGIWHITDSATSVPKGVKLKKTHIDSSITDLQKTLSEEFPPKNKIEQARTATVLIKSAQEGSGFFITDDGYILTSKHILKDAFRHKIYLIDKTEYLVYVQQISETHDLALLKLDGYRCPFIAPADATRLAYGTPVYAIGNPIGLTHTVTSGILSGRRQFDNTDYLQTNAQINPGNSGGPLITQDGRVIGINTIKYTGKAVEGISFSIPINTALDEFSNYLGRRYNLD